MIPERRTLGDGIYLNLLPCDKFKTNYLSVDFLCPMRERDAASSALLPFVLSRGTAKYPDMTELTRAFDRLYGTRVSPHVFKTGDTQCFGFSCYPLREEYAGGTDVTGQALALLAETISAPYTENGLLSASYTESEKRVMTDRIQAQINDKASYSVLRCREILAEGEAYAIPESGRAEEVAALTPRLLTDRLAEARESLRIEIYAVGHFDKEALTEKAAAAFCFPGRRTPEPLLLSPSPLRKEVTRVTESQPVRQGKLCLGFKTGASISSRDLPAHALFTEVLGGSPVSKLFLNVREKQSLCYYCSTLGDVGKGILMIASGIEVSDRERAEQAILEQLAQCREGKISEEELQAAKKSLLNSSRSLYDSAGALKSWYLKNGISDDAEDPLALAERAASASVSDVMEAANRLSLDTVYFLEGTDRSEEGEDAYV